MSRSSIVAENMKEVALWANHCDTSHRSRGHENDLQVIEGRISVSVVNGVHVDIIPYEDTGHHSIGGHLPGYAGKHAVERSSGD